MEKTKTQLYYEKNRERILERAKESYHQKKHDIDYYQTLLKRSNECYHRLGRDTKIKNKSVELTKEEIEADEKQMRQIIAHVKHVQECDKKKKDYFLGY